MLAKKSVTTMRIDEDLKRQSKELFNSLGMDFTTAVTLFLKRSIAEQRIPFEVGLLSSPEALKAKREVENGETVKFDSYEDFEKDLMGGE